MASTVIPTIPSTAPKSIAYALTYGGTTYSSVDNIKNDYVVLHKNVGTSYSSSAIDRVSLGTILSSATSTHTPGFVNLGDFESAYHAILKLSNKDWLLSVTDATSSSSPRVSIALAQWKENGAPRSLTCIVTAVGKEIYEHLFINGLEFTNYAYYTGTQQLYTVDPWIQYGGNSLKWHSSYNKYYLETTKFDSMFSGVTITIDPTIFPYYSDVKQGIGDAIPVATSSISGLMSSAQCKQLNRFADTYSYLVKGNLSSDYNYVLSEADYNFLQTLKSNLNLKQS